MHQIYKVQDDNEQKKAHAAKQNMPTPKGHKPQTRENDAHERPINNQNINKRTKRVAMLWLGWLCIVIAPIIGAIPGPGFIVIFPIGLALVLKNSRWAKGLYIKFKRKFPEYGRWTDWALRRKGQREMPPLPPFKEQVKRLLGR